MPASPRPSSRRHFGRSGGGLEILPRRQDPEIDAPAGFALGFEFGLELASAVNLGRLHLERHLFDDFAQELAAVLRGHAPEGLGAGPLCDGVELLDRGPPVLRGYGRGVDLDDVSGRGRLEAGAAALGPKASGCARFGWLSSACREPAGSGPGP